MINCSVERCCQACKGPGSARVRMIDHRVRVTGSGWPSGRTGAVRWSMFNGIRLDTVHSSRASQSKAHKSRAHYWHCQSNCLVPIVHELSVWIGRNWTWRSLFTLQLWNIPDSLTTATLILIHCLTHSDQGDRFPNQFYIVCRNGTVNKLCFRTLECLLELFRLLTPPVQVCVCGHFGL